MLTKELARDLGGAVKEYVERELAPLVKRLDALEQGPGSTGVKWAGIWEPSKTYGEGSLVTRSGGPWLRGVEVRPRHVRRAQRRPGLISPTHMARGCLMNLGACDLGPRVFVFPV